ncbi:hypothetical protein C4Q27_13170 [Pseudomonas sp. SWI36]|nr:hypothetical protein C4Q27_13170 [Pseudomonas sp. SWI36]
MVVHRPPVGAGLPAKGPALLANFHPPFTVAAATVFAGKPAKRPALLAQICETSASNCSCRSA